MTGRTLFMVVAAAVLALLLFVVVIQPAVERGGWGELALVGAAFLVILGFERWLRSR